MATAEAKNIEDEHSTKPAPALQGAFVPSNRDPLQQPSSLASPKAANKQKNTPRQDPPFSSPKPPSSPKLLSKRPPKAPHRSENTRSGDRAPPEIRSESGSWSGTSSHSTDSESADVGPSNAKEEGSVHSFTSSAENRLDEQLRDEIPRKWILTLSMHFRDGTGREKFFVTYIPEPNKWLRVSISVNYKEAEAGSLEEDLSTLSYQRDKNFAIYKSVYESLSEIRWFSTITNLMLKTKDEQLHINVAEDINEKIQYPPFSNLHHLHFIRHHYLIAHEDEVFFESHLSGFVYKVNVRGQTCVKKEITSIDTVHEFLYEIEALAALRSSKFVINLVGVVVSGVDQGRVITGVLLEYASGGALNDFFYDMPEDRFLNWNTKMTWIRQVVQGMADIHEGGFVQGDCTLSNVVLDGDENAKVVDINRRGCPIGWEPPEFRGMIQSGQRISMHIGVKSDLYQMGMVIWAIAMQYEDPDRAERPLTLDDEPGAPKELREVIASCLGEDPVERKSAKELLTVLKPFQEYNRNPMTIKEMSALPTREEIEASQKRHFMHRTAHSRAISEENRPGNFYIEQAGPAASARLDVQEDLLLAMGVDDVEDEPIKDAFGFVNESIQEQETRELEVEGQGTKEQKFKKQEVEENDSRNHEDEMQEDAPAGYRPPQHEDSGFQDMEHKPQRRRSSAGLKPHDSGFDDANVFDADHPDEGLENQEAAHL